MVDPASYLQDPQLLAAREAAASSGQLATQYATAAGSLPQKLEQAVKEKLDYNRSLIEEKNQAFANYTTAAPAAREKYSNVFDPFAREKLVAQERATAYMPYANSSDILKTSMGNMNDIINNAVGAFSGAVQAAQGASQDARQKYQDAFDWAKTMADIEMQKQQEKRLGTTKSKSALEMAIEAATLKELGLNPDGTPVEEDTNTLQEPPMTSGFAGAMVEYPPGSGTYWKGDGQGGWL